MSHFKLSATKMNKRSIGVGLVLIALLILWALFPDGLAKQIIGPIIPQWEYIYFLRIPILMGSSLIILSLLATGRLPVLSGVVPIVRSLYVPRGSGN